MARLTPLLALILALTCSIVRAHYSLAYPSPVGELREDDESLGPCGGYTPDLETVEATDFHVGGDSISVSTSHPQDHWLYRITFDNNPTAAPADNWIQIYPIVFQTGVNYYCQPAVTVPEEYVGRKAILSVVAKASDGLLYQCAAVNFVSGTGSKPEVCTNSTDVSASFADDSDLAALVGHGESADNTTTTKSGSVSSTPLSSTPTGTATEAETETPGAAVTTYGSIQGLGSLTTVALMAMLGAGLMA